MSLFGKILEKLGLKKEKPPETAAAFKPATTAAPAKPAVSGSKPYIPAASGPRPPAGPVVATPKPISEVDVVKHLEGLSAGKGLNWKVSIVDLLKLLDIDSSREARNELAKELGCPAELMSDSAKMNVWLHKAVLKKIAENGGNIPKELLD